MEKIRGVAARENAEILRDAFDRADSAERYVRRLSG